MIGECSSCGETAPIVGCFARDPSLPLCACCCDEDDRDDFDPMARDEDDDEDGASDPLEEELHMESKRERRAR